MFQNGYRLGKAGSAHFEEFFVFPPPVGRGEHRWLSLWFGHSRKARVIAGRFYFYPIL